MLDLVERLKSRSGTHPANCGGRNHYSGSTTGAGRGGPLPVRRRERAAPSPWLPIHPRPGRDRPLRRLADGLRGTTIRLLAVQTRAPIPAPPEARPQQKAKQTEEAKQDEPTRPEAGQGEAKAKAVGGRRMTITWSTAVRASFPRQPVRRGPPRARPGIPRERCGAAARRPARGPVRGLGNESERAAGLLTHLSRQLARTLRDLEGGLDGEEGLRNGHGNRGDRGGPPRGKTSAERGRSMPRITMSIRLGPMVHFQVEGELPRDRPVLEGLRKAEPDRRYDVQRPRRARLPGRRARRRNGRRRRAAGRTP